MGHPKNYVFASRKQERKGKRVTALVYQRNLGAYIVEKYTFSAQQFRRWQCIRLAVVACNAAFPFRDTAVCNIMIAFPQRVLELELKWFYKQKLDKKTKKNAIFAAPCICAKVVVKIKVVPFVAHSVYLFRTGVTDNL